MNNGDAARNIKEHIYLAIAVFVLALFWDHGVNALHAINIHLVRNEETHAYFMGEFQVIAMVLSSLHLIRKLNEYRYYGSLIPDFLKKEL